MHLARLRSYYEDAFLRHNAIFFIGSASVAALNYAYHPILSRLLTLPEFGEVQTIFSLMLVATLVLNVIGVMTVTLEATPGEPRGPALVADLQALTLYATIALTGALVALSPWLAYVFQFTSALPFIAFALLIVTALPLVFRRAHLQAQRDFWGVSLANILTALGRIFFAVIFVALGMGVLGALGGLIVGQLLALLYLYLKTRHARNLRLSFTLRPSRALVGELGHTSATLLATIAVTFLATGDVLFAKLYLAPEVAGTESGVSTVARIIYFATASIPFVLLPFIKSGDAVAARTRVMRQSLALIMLVSVPVLALFSGGPEVFVTLLGGGAVGRACLFIAPPRACGGVCVCR